MASRGWRVSLVGATGAVGEELLHVLEERRFPVLSLRAFASGESHGREVDFRGEPLPVERLDPARVAEADLVFCAAPRVLEELRPELDAAETRVVDLSGVLELDLDVPLYVPGASLAPAPTRWVAVARGIVGGLGLALRPLRTVAELERLSVVTLESASGAGRRGVGELSDQTLALLNAMTGETEEPEVFPESLAFDCLPLVGDLLEDGDASEERRLAHVLRRILALPGLPIEVTRVRVPIFGGSLACVHLGVSREIALAEAASVWEKATGIEVLEPDRLPTPRTHVGRDGVAVGRVRSHAGPPAALDFVLAQDDLRQGGALAAVEVAEILLAD